MHDDTLIIYIYTLVKDVKWVTNQRSFSRGTWHSFAASPTDVPPPRSVLWPSTAAPRRFPAPLRKLRNFGPQLGMTRAEKCMDFMEKNEGFWQFHQQALGRWMISNHEKARKNRQTGELDHVILENWWLKHQQLLFHETYRLGDPNHAQPIIRGFWGNWYQVINHTYSSCCWWNPGWNSNVSWLNQSSNMIHFDIPCFLVFPWTFYPWISWWTLHKKNKKQKQSHLWIKCG